jgi:hypothetical protein
MLVSPRVVESAKAVKADEAGPSKARGAMEFLDFLTLCSLMVALLFLVAWAFCLLEIVAEG